jgi:hypothetical protein
MNEGFEHLSQEQRDALAGEIRSKRRERDEVRKQTISAERGKLKNLLQSIIGKKSGSKALHERADKLHLEARQILEKAKERQPAQVEIIDERDPNNLLSNTDRNFYLSFHFNVLPYSTEGFAENPEQQSKLARFLIEKLALKERGALLDVGFGANIHISNTFAGEGIVAYALDEQPHDHTSRESMWLAPRKVRENEQGVEIMSGDIADIGSQGSQLADKTFGLVLFNGSWTAGGNNWTVAGEVMDAKYYNRPDKSETLAEFMDKETDEILDSCKGKLSKNGLIGIVSSRYAFHGAGYEYSQLPDEKLSFVDVYDRLQRLGAKKFYIFGVSQEGFDQMLARSVEQYPVEHEQFKLKPEEINSVREQLRTVSDLPNEDVYSRYEDNQNYQKSHIAGVKDATEDISGLNAVARIDAIFAEF